MAKEASCVLEMILPVALLERAGCENRPGDLLDEQRNTLRLGDDLLDDRFGERHTSGCLLDQLVDLPSAKLVERQQRDMSQLEPGRNELGPEVCDHHRPETRDPAQDPPQQLDRSRICPVSILEDDQQRTALSKGGPTAPR